MVERSEIDQMSKYMALMGGAPSSESGDAIPVERRPDLGDAAIRDMKAIMEKCQVATDNLLSETGYDRELREALVTEASDSGVRIGTWEIHSRQSGKRWFYDVTHAATGDPIAADLMLYEAAHGLVQILNSGGHMNSKPAIELLRAEQDYAGSIHDMALFRHQLAKHPNSQRASIFEARYGESKRRAVQARERVKSLYSSR